MEAVGGVDIGGTKMRWVRLERGRILDAKEVRTPRTKESFIAALRKILLSLKENGVRRAGIGFPATVRGTRPVRAPHNLPFLAGIDLASAAPSGMRIRADNDAHCFARAELRFGSGRGARRLLAITLGTGVGRALTRNGKVLRLVRLSRAERWEKAYQTRIYSPAPALARFLGMHLAPLIAELSPGAVVIGGGTLRKKNLFEDLRRDLRARGVRIPIRYSRLRLNAGAVGAALLVEK